MEGKINKNILAKVKKGFNLIIKGRTSIFLKILNERLYSNKLSFGLKRDMRKAFTPPKAKIDIKVRRLEKQDVNRLLNLDGLTEEETRMVEVQRDLINVNFKNCYVAVTADDTPCYMQWILSPSENLDIHRYFGMIFPKLQEKEFLLEGAYMYPAFRGLKVMPHAMYRIAEKASKMGADSVLTFVTINNIPSLKGCKSCGFYPYILRKEKWVLFRHYVSFEAIPEKILSDYNTATTSVMSI